jgi:glycosyltransferase involved in cell wall biosynthesis
MKYALIGPGCMTIPPNGWGAVESIVWDYYEILSSQDHQVVIINESDLSNIIQKTNEANPDIVHIMYDDHISIAPHINCKRIFYTTHFAYITHPDFKNQYSHYFHNIFIKLIENQSYVIFNVISKELLSVYQKYGFTGRYNIIHNGARSDVFSYKEIPEYENKSVYIGKIEERKSQYKYQEIDNVHFVGNFYNSSFDRNKSNYLGEWTKPVLYENLTKYANLILLSDGEADPLVVKEALIAGLGVVVSECASANLDLSKPFITVIPNNKLNDIGYVTDKIEENRKISITMRKEIRKYALETFSWSNIIKKYIDCCI